MEIGRKSQTLSTTSRARSIEIESHNSYKHEPEKRGFAGDVRVMFPPRVGFESHPAFSATSLSGARRSGLFIDMPTLQGFASRNQVCENHDVCVSIL